MDWTTDQIVDFAPDSGVAKSGRDLAQARKWVSAGLSDAALWGECLGSGADPYQTQIDLSEPAFKCSCPSRKFPCKHGIGLFLLAANSPSDVPSREEPDWVKSWLVARAAKSKPNADSASLESELKPTFDKSSVSKSIVARETKVAAGLEDLDLWLRDLMRGGLAELATKPPSYISERASRLVDSQSTGLARMVTEIGQSIRIGVGWEAQTLERIGRIFLLIEGYKRQISLPGSVRADIRAAVGWTQSQEEIFAGTGIVDSWIVAGTRTLEEHGLIQQRDWLMGVSTGRSAVVISFSHHSQTVKSTLTTGTVFAGELVYFAGSVPLRALVRERADLPDIPKALLPFGTVASALASYHEAVIANPWIEIYPMAVTAVVPILTNSSAYLYEPATGDSLPLAQSYDQQLFWRLASVCGGIPTPVFGEWNGRDFRPLSVWHNDRMVQI